MEDLKKACSEFVEKITEAQENATLIDYLNDRVLEVKNDCLVFTIGGPYIYLDLKNGSVVGENGFYGNTTKTFFDKTQWQYISAEIKELF